MHGRSRSCAVALLLCAAPMAQQKGPEPLTVQVYDVRDLVAAAEGAEERAGAGDDLMRNLKETCEWLTTDVEGRLVQIHQKGLLIARLPRDEHGLFVTVLARLREPEQEKVTLRFQVLLGDRIDEKVLGLEEGSALLKDRDASVAFLRKAQAASLRLQSFPPVEERPLRPWKAELRIRAKAESEPETVRLNARFALLDEGELALLLRPFPADAAAGNLVGGNQSFVLRVEETAVRALEWKGKKLLLLVTRQ